MVDIQITDVTTGAISGTGVFDKLMASIKVQIQEEYDSNRIKGGDYATVYLGALQSVLSQSMEFVLRERLVEAQIDDIVKGIEIKDMQKQIAYVERVIKDKEATTMGLDNAIRLREEARKQDTNYVYVPIYKDVV